MEKGGSHAEADAIRAIDRALGGLDGETSLRVMQWAVSKYGQQGRVNLPPQTAPLVAVSPLGASSARSGDIRSFVTEKNPKNFYQRVACIAYFLEKSRGLSELKNADINAANDEGRLGKLSNVAQFVRDATRKYGFLASVGHGKVGLSPRGEALVSALPDQERVKEALAAMPMRKKGRRRGAKK
jgi:hypothetical protein